VANNRDANFMNHYVYVLYNPTIRKYYKGYSTDLRDRLRSHARNREGYTSKLQNWRLVFYGVFPNKILALKFERYLKTGSGIAFTRKRLVNYLGS